MHDNNSSYIQHLLSQMFTLYLTSFFSTIVVFDEDLLSWREISISAICFLVHAEIVAFPDTIHAG